MENKENVSVEKKTSAEELKQIEENLNKTLVEGLLSSAKSIKNLDEFLFFSDNFGNRSIYLDASIEEGIGMAIENMIRLWNRVDDDQDLAPEDRKPIKLYINSPGGYVNEAFIVIDAIQNSRTPVYTINVGTAASAAYLILLAGHRRFAYPHSWFLFHEGSNAISADAHKFQNYADFYKLVRKRMKDFVLSHTKLTEEKYSEIEKDDYWFFAEEALENNSVDEILSDLI